MTKIQVLKDQDDSKIWVGKFVCVGNRTYVIKEILSENEHKYVVEGKIDPKLAYAYMPGVSVRGTLAII